VACPVPPRSLLPPLVSASLPCPSLAPAARAFSSGFRQLHSTESTHSAEQLWDAQRTKSYGSAETSAAVTPGPSVPLLCCICICGSVPHSDKHAKRNCA
jgi:hypothetical protein